MNDQQRHAKLVEAQKLIREVEFSYKEGEEPRRLLYRFVVNSFSNVGILNGYLTELKDKAEKYKKTKEEEEQEFLESLGVK